MFQRCLTRSHLAKADWSAQVQRARQVVADNAPIIQAQLSQAKAAVAEAAANAAAALEAKAKAG